MLIEKPPVGAAITLFNSPLNLICRKTGSALARGNTVVINLAGTPG
jgi:acyl-CoA reductase-like NAD-dependent aldehyde dehydrogenase